ncbi:MAG: hypothetical protein J3R72DRAFT_453716 [Linnemannia gamsii]|nr:MAG: hypothetical protein J3R72DRAFT_453716 [Linnemannia gamsii]
MLFFSSLLLLSPHATPTNCLQLYVNRPPVIVSAMNPYLLPPLPQPSQLPLQSTVISGKMVLVDDSPPATTPAPSPSIELNSKITVQLLDVTSSVGLPFIVGQQVLLVNPRQQRTFPIDFKVPYHTARIRSNRSYALRSTVLSSTRRLEFISIKLAPVLTNGAPIDKVTLSVHRV